MAYKIGDKVRIRKDFGKVSGTFVNEMKKWLDKVMTIKYVGNCPKNYYYMEEDVGEGYSRTEVQERHWTFFDDDIEGFAELSSIKFDTLL